MGFCVPKGQEYFYEHVVEKVVSLVSNKAWGEIDTLYLSAWLNNFSSDEEKYFAAHLLDAISFRSKKMIESSCFEIFHQIVPREIKSSPFERILANYVSSLTTPRSNSRIKFVTVQKKTAAASGDSMLRIFKRCLRVQDQHVIDLDRAVRESANIDVLIFIDDITGTGKQFCDCLNKPFDGQVQTLLEVFKDKLVIYSPLVGHQEALNNIYDEMPEIRVVPVELINNKQSFFHSDTGMFRDDGQNTVKDAKKFYSDFIKSRGLKIKNLYGFEEQALTCFFSDLSTPNNSLPVFYFDQDENWNPLFRR